MNQKLGIIDWGIGGISVYRLVKERLGAGGIVYFSDTGATPYGKMTRGELVGRLNTVIDFLVGEGVTRLVIGCNAASTAIPDLGREDIQIEGVIEPAVEMCAAVGPEKLGVIGGRRTVLSGVYRRKFAEKGIPVAQRIAQPLSGLIESGDTSSDVLRAAGRQILTPLRNCSHILLACTHYPAIAGVLKDYVAPRTVFVDPAAALVERIADWQFPPDGDDVFYTSGDPQAMRRAAQNAFGVAIERVLVKSL
ncbi:MAG: aspartate/glutamate racemase family protein [Acidobacteria bacterium]|nr:aspartate/glutamate racemase family protein [Acidobacteriota bacterium]